MRASLVASALAAAVCTAVAAPGAQWTIHDPGQGPVPLASSDTGAHQLSGLTWAEHARYYAVSDTLRTLYPLSIVLDPRHGTITHAGLAPGIALSGATDLEGVAYDATHATVLVADERGPAVREYRLDGSLVRTLPVPTVYRSARHNLALESLTIEPDEHGVWTANEETLAADGPRSNATAGSVVRLQHFDRHHRPAGQWAYVTDPTSGDLSWTVAGSGVVDLVALPGGGLLALERAFGAGGLRSRLYEVDRHGASDTSALSILARASYTPVRKALLWERVFPDINYEGAALGPVLDDGSRSLVLISDDGHSLRQTLYALTLRHS